ncbi:Cof-type HAD-IIB family hydrolase [Alkalicoccus daliensis]|uniref:HAD family phosphatase n=1 Tax=Alkalicoccus daliensis TaxID=745820 RepID=A0A1H0FVL7_9BACI|nr:Cof-type HAD-IIB family hydrolase [Alkalicoccus daliensis]SDN98696.1 hypothetical protein SAMN04488053_105112 [Alkalicoccus daliensis]
MAIKAVFSDIDGTLLNSDESITPATKKAIRKAVEKGISFVLVSARLPSGMLPMQEELEIETPMISYGGALVLSSAEKDAEIIYGVKLSPASVKKVYQTVKEQCKDVHCALYGQDEWRVNDPENEWMKREEATVNVPPVKENLDEYVEKEPPVYKMLCTGNAEELAKLEKILKEELSGVTVHKSKENNLEVVPEEASKATAIEKVLEKLEIRQEETLAFGDNYNDVDMLKFAGIGIAMGNAPDEVKQEADEVTASNDEDGIKDAIEKHIL